LEGETGVPGENHQPATSHRQTLTHNVESSTPRENHQPATSHWQTLTHNVESSTPSIRGIPTHKVSGDRHRLQLPYDHNHDGPLIWKRLGVGISKLLNILFHNLWYNVFSYPSEGWIGCSTFLSIVWPNIDMLGHDCRLATMDKC
jgi:hypothetical protein